MFPNLEVKHKTSITRMNIMSDIALFTEKVLLKISKFGTYSRDLLNLSSLYWQAQ